MAPQSEDPFLFEHGEAKRSSPRRSPEHGILLGLAGLGTLVMVLLGLFLHADARGYGTHEQLGLEPCYPLAAWNFPCPGCGVTTAVTLAAKGHPLASLTTQPFGFLLAVLLPLTFLWALREHFRGRDIWIDLQGKPWASWCGWLLVVMVLAWVYKISRVRGWY